MREIGINVASLLPWSIGPKGPALSVEIAQAAGFDGLQLLPLRGWTRETMADIPQDFVLSWEREWNSGRFFGAILRHAGLRGEECPLLMDWALFGSAERVRNSVAAISDCFPNALHISHNPGSFPIEANPEAGLTMKEYITYKPGIVWDTEHVVRSGRHCELPVTSYWERFLPQVAGNIKVIHAKTDPVSNGMVSSKMFKALARETGPTCPIIVECRPKRALTVRQTIKKLKSVREATDYYFSDIS